MGVLYKYTVFKEPVYKELALGWQIAKQLSGFYSSLLSDNKSYRKVEFFLCNKHKITANPKKDQNSAISKVLLGKF